MVQKTPFRSDACDGRVALITGGGTGIGFEIARQLGLHGSKVCIMGRRVHMLQEAVKLLTDEGIDAMYVSGDVREEVSCGQAVDSVLQKWGTLNVLINSAAGNFMASSESLSSNGFKTVMEIDTQGTYNMCHAAFPSLKEAGKSCIINVTVNSKWREGRTWYQVHAASAKAAITTMSHTLALEWGSHGIRVNNIGPGYIGDTPGMAMGGSTTEKLEQRFAPIIPLGRLGRKFDCAMAAVFMVTQEYISGHTLVVDGAEWIYSGPRPMPAESLNRESRQQSEKRKRELGPNSRL